MGYLPKVMYWGGGTPTRLEVGEMAAIKQALEEGFDLTDMVEWSMETTPNELDPCKLAAIEELGVNRISIGVQSFEGGPNSCAYRGGPIHPSRPERPIGLVRNSTIDNFNVDLICGFPEESAESLRQSLLKTVAMEPKHISIYPYRMTPGNGGCHAGWQGNKEGPGVRRYGRRIRTGDGRPAREWLRRILSRLLGQRQPGMKI